MGRPVDLSGKVFGRLQAIAQAGRDNQCGLMWLCLCDCGNEKTIASRHLRSGATTSCGCWQRDRASEHNLYDRTGKTFGRLTVLNRAETGNYGQVRWWCRCVCGNVKTVIAQSLTTGHTQSCGCLFKTTAVRLRKGKPVSVPWVHAHAGRLDNDRATYVYWHLFMYELDLRMKIGVGKKGCKKDQLGACRQLDKTTSQLKPILFPSEGAAYMCERLVHVRLDEQNRRRALPKGTFRNSGETEVFEDQGDPAADLREAVLDPRWEQLVAPRLAAVGVDPDIFRAGLLTS